LSSSLPPLPIATFMISQLPTYRIK
jgi:hypothetical protein